jgi:hypothetical protein
MQEKVPEKTQEEEPEQKELEIRTKPRLLDFTFPQVKSP